MRIMDEERNWHLWELYLEAERRDLQLRQEGHLARLLGAQRGDLPEGLERIVREDRRRAQEGLVELRRPDTGEVSYKHIDDLISEDRPYLVEARRVRAAWIRDRRCL
jgi:hypothetical protein